MVRAYLIPVVVVREFSSFGAGDEVLDCRACDVRFATDIYRVEPFSRAVAENCRS
jgi:hypothetical protein